jgi:hypothetical protein
MTDEVSTMADATTDDAPPGHNGTGDAAGAADDGTAAGAHEEGAVAMDPLAVASFALSAIGFLTLLRLADRRERSAFSALGLFVATTLESTAGAALGLSAATRNKDPNRLSKGFLLGAAGAVLGVITTALNFNWMRTRRRV